MSRSNTGILKLERAGDKEVARLLRSVKEYNHELAKKDRDIYERDVEYTVRYDGINTNVLSVNHKTGEKAVACIERFELEEGRMTKQFRSLTYIIRKVREYNEIEGKGHFLVLYYTGDVLIIHKVYSVNKRETIFNVNIMSMPYSRATKVLTKIPHRIEVMATEL